MRNLFKIFFFLITTTLIFSSCNNAGLSPQKALQVINKDTMLNDVNVLSADSMLGRAPGTIGEVRASKYIAKRFKNIGLEKVKGSYFQTFNIICANKNSDKSSLIITRHNKILKYKSDETLTYCYSSQ